MNDEEKIILVDGSDTQIGAMEKMETHRKGLRHRAFSIFIKNRKGEIMLQLRAKTKYHSGGLWTNTCCGHPRDGEEIARGAHRRLREEMGFDCEMKETFVFSYKTDFADGLIENEIDHVFVGEYNDKPKINSEEADGWKWVSLEKVMANIAKNPGDYTYWFKIALEKAVEKGVRF